MPKVARTNVSRYIRIKKIPEIFCSACVAQDNRTTRILCVPRWILMSYSLQTLYKHTSSVTFLTFHLKKYWKLGAADKKEGLR